MKITLAGTRALSGEPPRSTAYYYADLEKIKRKNAQESYPPEQPSHQEDQNNELSDYVESNEVIDDGPVAEVPPLRDRVRQWSPPEYNTPNTPSSPENPPKAIDETYSTAGTFPMPQAKEKEPLLAELEVVGRLPLTQLDNASGVRRSRSWYLCCPNVGEEEISRESSWRYSSLRPVTAPPLPGQNGMTMMVATQSSGHDDAASLRVERDALARALAAERQRAATEARAHDARLAELHGVIAELVRRRAADKHSRAIPEEEVSDECESTTQPAGELDHDADRSRTDQNDSLSLASPASLPLPQDPKVESELPDDSSAGHVSDSADHPRVEVTSAHSQDVTDNCDTSLNLSERDSEICLTTARCCQYARKAHSTSAGDSCEREHGSIEARVYTASPGRDETRRAKIAARVRLRRSDGEDGRGDAESWCVEAEAAERLALDVCAQADLREALVAASNDGEALTASVCWLRARCARLEADCRVLQCSLSRASDTAHRLYVSCAAQESCCVSACCALRAADRALEVYDVLLALAETHGEPCAEREAAELVARQLLTRLDVEQTSASIGEPLLPPGPWLQHDNQVCAGEAWGAAGEARLRAHAARLKAETVTLRDAQRHQPTLFSYHDIDEDDLPKSAGNFNMAEMEAAVTMQEALQAREQRAAARRSHHHHPHHHQPHPHHADRKNSPRRFAAETEL